MGNGFLSRLATGLDTPSKSMTWKQLGASVIFVLAVLIAWRQVTLFIMREV